MQRRQRTEVRFVAYGLDLTGSKEWGSWRASWEALWTVGRPWKAEWDRLRGRGA